MKPESPLSEPGWWVCIDGEERAWLAKSQNWYGAMQKFRQVKGEKKIDAELATPLQILAGGADKADGHELIYIAQK